MCEKLHPKRMQERKQIVTEPQEGPRQYGRLGWARVSRYYKIGDLAKEFNVTLRTLRFYEDKGLIQPERSGTTRLYTEYDREQLRIALFCKRIGLSLIEIRDVLALHDSSNGDVEEQMRVIYADRLRALEQQRTETDRTIADLQTRIEALGGKIHH